MGLIGKSQERDRRPQDEPSHWTPYDAWLRVHGRPGPNWRERTIDSSVHGELLLFKLPILLLAPRLKRRSTWPDQNDGGLALEPLAVVA